jgi:hypothetical protein
VTEFFDPAEYLTQTGTVALRDPGPDVDDMGDVAPATTPGSFACWLYQTVRDENTVGGDTQEETWTLILEPAAAGVVDGSSAITVDAVTYEFTGPPWQARSPVDGVVFVEATVRLVA